MNMLKQFALSGLDWQILELLRKNGRISISEIAERLNRSRSSISEHLEQMQTQGIIKGFTVEVDPEKMGFGIKAFVRLTAPSSEHRKIIETIASIPEVIESHVLTGEDLLMLQIVARDMPHLRLLVDGMTLLGSTQTDIVFSTVKEGLDISAKLRKIVEE
jgi:Lrp/AsnC family transcriptional regulator, leucine-responsive regulatory protein